MIGVFVLSLMSFEVTAADISNFVSGPVCHHEDGSESICGQDEDIYVTGQSTCTYAGERKPCTWFGFQFDYENANPEIPIVCTYWRSEASDEGNYETVRHRSANTGEFRIELNKTSGHFYNPMYQLYSPPPGKDFVIVTSLSCSIEDKPVFEMTFNLRFTSD